MVYATEEWVALSREVGEKVLPNVHLVLERGESEVEVC